MPQIYLRTDLYEEIVSRGHRGEAVGEFVNKAVAKVLVDEEREEVVRKGFEVKEVEK
jgi:hypothetical protein